MLRIKRISRLTMFLILSISLICLIMSVSAMAKSPKQFPGKLIGIAGAQLTTSQEDFVKNNTVSVLAKGGTPIYAVRDGTILLGPPPRNVRLYFEEFKVHIWMGGDLKTNLVDGQQFKSGDIIGWFPETKLRLKGIYNSYQFSFSCGDGEANDPRVYIDGLAENNEFAA